MDRGLYITASGMQTELLRQERIANDLANGNTPGYKPDLAGNRAFSDMLLVNRQTGAVVGPAGTGVLGVDDGLDVRQGALRGTDEQFDVALDGPGWIAIQTETGISYTRNGQFRLDAKGQLVNPTGLPVLGEDKKPIVIPPNVPVEINADGVISAAGKTLGTLLIVGLEAPSRTGEGLYTGTVGAKPKDLAVRQGYLEASAVNPSESMVAMIVSLRAFEAGQRVLHAIDETLQRGINSAGATAGG